MEIDRPIIWLASEDWDPKLVLQSYHITTQLSKSTPVLFCNSIGIRRPALVKADISKVISKLANFSRGVREVQENICLLSPLGVPVSLGDWAININAKLVPLQISRAARRQGFRVQDALFWVTFPGWLSVIKELDVPPEQVVLHFFDRWEAYGRTDREMILKLRNELLSLSGAVLATAGDITEELKQIHPNVYHSPHGLNLELFTRFQDNGPPEDMVDIPSKIAGFFGTINSFWIDFNLIYQCAVRAPQVSWVFIGPEYFISEEDRPLLAGLQDLPNVHFLGSKKHEELPKYGVRFDAGLMPFKDSQLTRSASPLKLYEYLALELPVISTVEQQYGDLSEYVEVVGSDPEGYLGAVLAALEESPDERVSRRKAVESYSWPQVVDRYINSLHEAGIEL